jgi:hypothetical protein
MISRAWAPSRTTRPLLKIGGAVLSLSLSGGAAAEEPHVPFVRMAELEIDPARLESYKAEVKEEMETSVRVEPGVLAIYAVAEADDPSRLRFFEMYSAEYSKPYPPGAGEDVRGLGFQPGAPDSGERRVAGPIFSSWAGLPRMRRGEYFQAEQRRHERPQHVVVEVDAGVGAARRHRDADAEDRMADALAFVEGRRRLAGCGRGRHGQPRSRHWRRPSHGLRFRARRGRP